MENIAECNKKFLFMVGLSQWRFISIIACILSQEIFSYLLYRDIELTPKLFNEAFEFFILTTMKLVRVMSRKIFWKQSFENFVRKSWNPRNI